MRQQNGRYREQHQTDMERVDTRTQGFDDPCELVAEALREGRGAAIVEIAASHLDVQRIHTSGQYPHPDIAIPRRRRGDAGHAQHVRGTVAVKDDGGRGRSVARRVVAS